MTENYGRSWGRLGGYLGLFPLSCIGVEGTTHVCTWFLGQNTLRDGLVWITGDGLQRRMLHQSVEADHGITYGAEN